MLSTSIYTVHLSELGKLDPGIVLVNAAIAFQPQAPLDANHFGQSIPSRNYKLRLYTYLITKK
jgi:hypothetical protein